jgi:aspartate racemase
MKTIGIIGGIAPASTIEYYRSIIARYRALKPDDSYPPIIINSIDMTKMLGLIGAQKLAELTGFLLGEVSKLAHAGAQLGLFASNTPHLVFGAIERQSPIPLISIVEASCRATEAMGLNKVGLFGTRFTMQARFYPEVFSGKGIAVIAPNL